MEKGQKIKQEVIKEEVVDGDDSENPPRPCPSIQPCCSASSPSQPIQQKFDCAVTVNCSKSGCQMIYKCRKDILTSASPVFEFLFSGMGSSSTENAINLDWCTRLTPNAFLRTVMYLYDNSSLDFGDLETAIGIYTFSFQMQISKLEALADTHLKKCVGPARMFSVYEAYKSTNNSASMSHCWKVILKNTSQILKSDSWKDVHPSSVLRLLQEDKLFINSEQELFLAVVSWGKSKFLSLHGREPQPQELRPLILPFIQLIRFRNMDREEFSQLCFSTHVLTAEEKLAVLHSLTLNDITLMPAGFSRGWRRLEELLTINIPFKNNFTCTNQVTKERKIFFKVSESLRLVGVQIDKSNILELRSIVLKDSVNKIKGQCQNQRILGPEGEEFYSLQQSQALANDNLYKLVVDFTPRGQLDFIFEKEMQVRSKWLTVTFPRQMASIRVTAMVFKPV